MKYGIIALMRGSHGFAMSVVLLIFILLGSPLCHSTIIKSFVIIPSRYGEGLAAGKFAGATNTGWFKGFSAWPQLDRNLTVDTVNNRCLSKLLCPRHWNAASYSLAKCHDCYAIPTCGNQILSARRITTIGGRRYKRPCAYYPNTMATFNLLLIGDLVFKLNPGPIVNSIHSIVTHRDDTCYKVPSSSQTRNLGNMLSVSRAYINRPSPSISFCLLNAQSSRNKSADLLDYFCDCKADLFAITETWLNPKDDAVRAELCPAGFRLVDHPRTSRMGGGTALLFRDSLTVSKVGGGEKESFEFSEWVVQLTSSNNIRVVVLYRTPYSEEHRVTTNTFFSEFSDYLETVILSREPLLIVGDFNIHVDIADDVDSIKFLDLLESVGMQQHVKHPTHVKGHTLDLIITRQSDGIIKTAPKPDRYLSDHLSILCCLHSEKPSLTSKTVSYRKWKSVSSDIMNKELEESELCKNPPEDLDDLVACYNETLKATLDKHAPLISKVIVERPRVPWFSDEIKEAKRQRRKAEKKWRNSKLDIDFILFKKKRNEATRLMNRARQEFYTNLINENSGNQGKLFKASNQLFNRCVDRGIPPNIDSAKFATDIGSYFVQKIVNIRRTLDGGHYDVSPLRQANTNSSDLVECNTSMFSKFDELSASDISSLIRTSSLKTCPLDPMPSLLVSQCHVLLPIIMQIINTSLQSGCFPDVWKEALVFPLLKKRGLDILFKNFRPVSNLSFVSKLAERAVFDQTHVHMTTNDLYPSAQSSYRKHHSTETALLKIKNDLLLNMNKQHVSLLVLLDLSAAFDTVDHTIMIERLSTKLGMSGTAISWFQSYLSGRSQRVSVNGSLSDRYELCCGVPQGSCLGPLLFTIYASKLFDIIEGHLPEVHCYADDTQLYVSFSPKEENGQSVAVSAMERCVADIRQWMSEDKLFMNDDKTEVLLIGTQQQLSKININSIHIGDADIPPAELPVKNLGVWFDRSLSMNTHITKTSSAAFYYLYNIRRIRKYLSKEHTKTLIHAFITCRLDYCNSLLYGMPAYQLAKLQRVQNAAARLIFEESKFCHITPLLRALHWLPVEFRIQFKILLITYKAINGQAPIYIQNMLAIKHCSSYSLRSNDNMFLSLPKLKSYATLGDRSFIFAAPRLWNNLPRSLRYSSSVEIFKRVLKTFLFKKAFL